MHQHDCKCELCRPAWWIKKQVEAIQNHKNQHNSPEITEFGYQKLQDDLNRILEVSEKLANKVIKLEAQVKKHNNLLTGTNTSSAKIVKSEQIVKPPPDPVHVPSINERIQDHTDKIELLEVELAEKMQEKKQAIVIAYFMVPVVIAAVITLTLSLMVAGAITGAAALLMLTFVRDKYFNNTTDIKHEIRIERMNMNRAINGLPPMKEEEED